MTDKLKLYKQKKETVFRKIVNSPFTRYRLEKSFKCYELRENPVSRKGPKLVALEGVPKSFDKSFPNFKEKTNMQKLLEKEKTNLLTSFQKKNEFLSKF